jgi:simple sugar transport system permease protein
VPPDPPFFTSFLRRKELAVLISLIIVTGAFALFSRYFLTVLTFGGIFTIAAETGVVAVGVTLLMISGEFDLSVGSNFALSAMILATLTVVDHWPELAAFATALFVATSLGFLNGILTLKTRIPSFIVTLGTMMVWRGVVLLYTAGFPISYPARTALLDALAGRYGQTNLDVLWWIIISVICLIILERTKYGNWTFATGGKVEAARELGVNVSRIKLVNFSITGLLAGLGGCFELARLGSMSPAYGDGLELVAIASAVIGGTSLMGGYGTIVGTILGAIILAMVDVGLVLAGAPTFWYQTFVGIIIILAVAMHVQISGLVKWRMRIT